MYLIEITQLNGCVEICANILRYREENAENNKKITILGQILLKTIKYEKKNELHAWDIFKAKAEKEEEYIKVVKNIISEHIEQQFEIA